MEAPSLTQIEMIDIGHKSLPIIMGPYYRQQNKNFCVKQSF